MLCCSINDGTTFKDENSMRKKAFAPRKKVGSMGMHTETIEAQELQVKISLEKILIKIPTKRYGMDLRLMPQLGCDMDTRQNTRLCNAMVRHKKVLAIFCDIKALEFDGTCAPISSLDRKMIRMIIMDLEETGGEKCLLRWNSRGK